MSPTSYRTALSRDMCAVLQLYYNTIHFSFCQEVFSFYRQRLRFWQIVVFLLHFSAGIVIIKDTAHSLNTVPFIYVTDNNSATVKDGRLADVAPSILHIMGLEQPSDMTGENLICDNK